MPDIVLMSDIRVGLGPMSHGTLQLHGCLRALGPCGLPRSCDGALGFIGLMEALFARWEPKGEVAQSSLNVEGD